MLPLGIGGACIVSEKLVVLGQQKCGSDSEELER